MGLMDDLFGDSGGQIMSTDLRKLTNELGGLLRGQLGKGADVYGGQLTPGMNQNTLDAFGAAGGLMTGNPEQDAAIQRLMSGAGDIEGVNQFYQQSVLDPSRRDFNDALRVVDDRYGDVWGTSGAHAKAVADATSNYGIGLGQVLGNLVYNDRNAAADRQLGGVQASQSAEQNQMAQLNTLLGVGDYQRGLEGEGLAADYSQWQAGQAYNNPWLGFLGTALSTAQPSPPRAGLLEKAQAGFSFVDPFMAGRF
jgi:hypothetical protein